MNGAMATEAAGGSHDGAAVTPPRRRAGWPCPAGVIIALTTLIGLGLRAYLVVRPGLLAVTQYDDGPYFGSAVRLVHGVLPYRGFAFVQPPGITLLMSPAAALSYPAGTATALVTGRLLTVAAGAASVPAGGLLVRHRGPVAVLVTCGILAIYPPAAAAAHTVLLEPWLVLACLLGTLAVFDGDRLASGRRLAWGGVAFGFAGLIKAWAIAPVLVILLLCLPSLRRAAVFAAGVAAGFLAPALPFLAAAPGSFYHGVVVAQLSRAGSAVSPWLRLHIMLGVPPGLGLGRAGVLGMLSGVFVVAILATLAAWLVTRRPPPPLDRFALAATALVGAMFMWPPYFAAHYAAFITPFLALAVALPLARLLATVGWPVSRARLAHWLAGAAGAVAGAALVAAAVFQALPYAGAPVSHGTPSLIGQVIPPGACVLTDQSVYLLVTDRFVARSPRCPQMVDSLGTDLALSAGRRPATGAAEVPAVQAAWRQAFGNARYVVLTGRNRLRVPWTPALSGYFHHRFRPVLHARDYVIYERRAAR